MQQPLCPLFLYLDTLTSRLPRTVLSFPFINGFTMPCKICHDLEPKDPGSSRLALDCAPHELIETAQILNCPTCTIIHRAIERFGRSSQENRNNSNEPEPIDINNISRVDVYGLGNEHETLSVDLYFQDDKPKRVLELFVQNGKNIASKPKLEKTN